MHKQFCPFCMSEVQASDCCPQCGKDVHYVGYPGHLPVGYTLQDRHVYIMGSYIGQGGFGITYIALDMTTNQRVAIKEYYPSHCCIRNSSTHIYPSAGQEETYTKGKHHFLQEAQMLQSLSDLSSVVKVLDFFEANNSAYLVMEYLDGSSLKDHVEKNGKLDAQTFLKQMQPLMADMEKMHRRGVVHRDIAPDNIILLPDGRLKLIDFGAARSYVGDKSMTVVVKKGFAPVEQYMRKGSNASTDVYALAATIYYCITGIVPPDSAERQYGEAQLTAPSLLGADLLPQQEQALEKALEIQPKARTQTVEELMNELSQIFGPAKSKTETAKAVSKTEQIKTPNKSKWWIPAVAAMVLCICIVALFVGIGEQTPSERTKQADTIRTEHPKVEYLPEETMPWAVELNHLGGAYQGAVVDGQPHGAGTLIWQEGCYDGNFSMGYPSGTGIFTFSDGSSIQGADWGYGSSESHLIPGDYQGMLLNGQAAGYGVLSMPYGGVYQGTFRDNHAYGEGEYTYRDSSTISGFWNWVSSDRGIWVFDRQGAEMFYTGMTCDGVLSAYGSLSFTAGGSFRGEFSCNSPSGWGIYTYRNPSSESSKQMEGNSWTTVFDEYRHKTHYYGLKLDGKWQGFGIGITESNYAYCGEILDDFRDGYGELYTPKDTIERKGIYRNGQLSQTLSKS